MAILAINEIGFSYRRHGPSILDGLSLSFEAEGLVGLLGPNGSGKTTLVKLMATVLFPQSGTICFWDQVVSSERHARAVRSRIGYLPQSFGAFAGFTVLEFASYCTWLRGAQQSDRVLLEALDQLAMSQLASSKMGALSGGQAQRVGIAQAIAGAPPLVLLDEPSAGLDPAQRIQMRDAIRRLTGSLVIMSTHLIEDVIAMCDEVVVMNGGVVQHRSGVDEFSPDPDRRNAGMSAAERAYMRLLAP